jgi:hypothetical protein
MHATNTFPVDRHPQYRHYPTTIRSIASGIIIEVRKNSHQIQVILGRPFLATANVLINCRIGLMKITFGNMTVELNIFDINNQPLSMMRS